MAYGMSVSHLCLANSDYISRVATALIDGPIPVDKVHLQLVDCVVQSLLEMPEHRELVLNWRVLIQAIRSVVDRKGTTEKLELTIQRVLLRILVASAERAHEHAALVLASGSVTNKASSSEDINGLSSTLLQSIPNLLSPFKSDVVGMRQISKLPLLISPAVLSLSARKADFQTVLKSLCQMYLESNDHETLQNVALMLSKWVDGDHTRVADVKFQLKRLSEGLLKRLMDLFRETDPGSAKPQRASPRRSKHGKGERTCSSSVDMFSVSSDLEVEQAIVLQMHRLKMLLTACNANHLFEDSANDQKESKVDGLFSMISEAIAQRLKDRKPTSEGDKGNESGSVSVPSIWRDEDPDLHIEVAKNVDVSLRVLLLIVSHELSDVLEARNDVDITSYRETDIELDRLPVVRHRNHLATLLIMCFDQFIEHNDACTDDELTFSEKVQISAGQVSSDLRSLFPCELSEAVDPVRRALSMQQVPNHMLLVGGFARWLQNASLQDVAENEILVVSQTTAPLCKSIAANTKDVSDRFRIFRLFLSSCHYARLETVDRMILDSCFALGFLVFPQGNGTGSDAHPWKRTILFAASDVFDSSCQKGMKSLHPRLWVVVTSVLTITVVYYYYFSRKTQFACLSLTWLVFEWRLSTG